MIKLYWRIMNWVRGVGFYWQDDVLEVKPGTCPYPVHDDWSAKGCIKRGECGCDELDRANEQGDD